MAPAEPMAARSPRPPVGRGDRQAALRRANSRSASPDRARIPGAPRRRRSGRPLIPPASMSHRPDDETQSGRGAGISDPGAHPREPVEPCDPVAGRPPATAGSRRPRGRGHPSGPDRHAGVLPGSRCRSGQPRRIRPRQPRRRVGSDTASRPPATTRRRPAAPFRSRDGRDPGDPRRRPTMRRRTRPAPVSPYAASSTRCPGWTSASRSLRRAQVAHAVQKPQSPSKSSRGSVHRRGPAFSLPRGSGTPGSLSRPARANTQESGTRYRTRTCDQGICKESPALPTELSGPVRGRRSRPPAAPRRPILPPHGAGARGAGTAPDHTPPPLQVQLDQRAALLAQSHRDRRAGRDRRPGAARWSGPQWPGGGRRLRSPGRR